jgi:NifU-like protein involved in Fe-S cluster formation
MGQFSEILMDHFNSPRNYGRIETPDRVGIAGTPGLGPYVAFYLRLAGDVISEARFQTHGCGVSIACGSMLTEMIMGRAAGDCLELTPEHLAEWRGSDPANGFHGGDQIRQTVFRGFCLLTQTVYRICRLP